MGLFRSALAVLLLVAQVQGKGAECEDRVSSIVCESIAKNKECSDPNLSELSSYCQKTCGNCTMTTPESVPINIDCDFDSGPCEWIQDTEDDFDWSLLNGPTRTILTGPLTDHTSGEGQFMFIETSSPRTKNDRATLMYEFPMSMDQGCFSMYYHMYGGHLGTIKVTSTDVNGTVSKLWSDGWTSEDRWLKMSISIPKQTAMIAINGFVGSGRRGDIAIDDTSFTPDSCVSPTDDPAFKDPIG